MSIVYKYDGSTISDVAGVSVNQSIINLSTNADGTFATLEVEVLDLNGTRVFAQWHAWDVEETDDTVNPRCFTGRIVSVKVERFGSRGVARRWNLTVQDINYRLHMRVFRSDDANRPAETGSTRIAWLLTKLLADGLAYDNGSVASNDYNLPKADYRGRYADEVLGDIASLSTASPYTFFVYWDPVALQHSLFYGPVTSTTFDSILSISSVPGDAGDLRDSATTCYPIDSATAAALDGAGEDIYDGLYLTWGTGNHTYRQRPATFAATGLHRDGVVDNSRLTDQGAVDFYMTRWLEVHSGQVDTVTCVVRLPSSKVNRIDAGMRISARFEQFPGWDPAVYSRVVKRGYAVPVEGQKKWYDVGLTLSSRGWLAGGGTGPPSSVFPHPPAGPPALVQSKTRSSGSGTSVVLDSTPGVGGLLVAVVGWRSAAGPLLTGFTQVGSTVVSAGGLDNLMLQYRVTQTGDTATLPFATGSGLENVVVVSEWTGSWSTPVDVTGSATGSGIAPTKTITPTAGKSAVIIGGAVNTNTNVPQDTTYVAGAGWTLIGQANVPAGHPVVGAVYKVATSTSGSYSPNLTATSGYPGDGSLSTWAEIAASFVQDATASPPAPGQEVGVSPPESVTLTAGAGTTLYPFADGSLRVFYDIVEQTAAIVSYNGATGAFTMPSQPPLGSQVFVRYQGR